MRTKTLATLCTVAAAAMLITGTASAQQQSVDLVTPLAATPGAGEGGYLWSDKGLTSTWRETNGKLDAGLYADTTGSRVLGLQMHDVCYGLFHAGDIAHNNTHVRSYKLTTYVPISVFGGTTAEDCQALCEECFDRCNDAVLFDQLDALHQEECTSEVLDMPCALSPDVCEFAPADTLVAGSVPNYNFGECPPQHLNCKPQ